VLNATTPAQQNQFLFWDHLHPTAQGHAVLATTAQSTLFGGA
jgi:phospholipase/lecithinase/hemolysin